MSPQENCFTSFKESIDSFALPAKFTFPFCYEPHPLCLLAAEELQHHLQTQNEWNHDFGISGDSDSNSEAAIGKMFGVLLVQNENNEIGYLTAFSGKIADKNHIPGFVPPVFDMLEEGSFFMVGQLEINQINDQIESLESNPEIQMLETALQSEIEASAVKIEEQRARIIDERKGRKQKRVDAKSKLKADEFIQLEEQLAKESVKEKNTLKYLQFFWGDRVLKAENNLTELTAEINRLKEKRKDLSAALQKRLFDQYRFLNKAGAEKNLREIFLNTPRLTPPAGAGECAAPKLLHYAFKWGMKPLAIAEFWWGQPPKSEIRKHKNYYAACLGKCQPILEHMLEGIEVDDNPLLNNPAEGKTIDVVYEDESFLVINKPAEFLSVPGKQIEDSVYLRIKQSYPRATGPLIVHRLDMSTSGLMVIALNKEVHKSLQRQFIKRSVKKRYVALLDGLLKEDKGIIDLPLHGDFDDRPRQLVCYEYGKAAKTQWEVVERKNNKTKVYFYPITGRTHQLRVHSAHVNGLNTAIVGDDLYGTKANRLHLHAGYLEFTHPVTKELMSFEVEAEF